MPDQERNILPELYSPFLDEELPETETTPRELDFSAETADSPFFWADETGLGGCGCELEVEDFEEAEDFLDEMDFENDAFGEDGFDEEEYEKEEAWEGEENFGEEMDFGVEEYDLEEEAFEEEYFEEEEEDEVEEAFEEEFEEEEEDEVEEAFEEEFEEEEWEAGYDWGGEYEGLYVEEEEDFEGEGSEDYEEWGEEILEKEFTILPSCDPGKFKLGKLKVVRWGSRRNPCNRQIPSNLQLGILSRGRIRLPFRNVEPFLAQQRSYHKINGDRNFWLLRTGLGKSLRSLAPEIDVTFELFILQENLGRKKVTDIFQKYLEQRVKNELKNCEFFLFDARVANEEQKELLERDFSLSDFDLNLNKLYQRVNVKLTGRSCGKNKPGENIDRFILLTYITFPSELNAFLLPPVFPKREKYTSEEARAIRKAAEKLLRKGNANEKELGCILKMTLRKNIRDEWLSRDHLAWYLHLNKSKTKNLSPVGERSRSLRAEIIAVFERSKNLDDFLKRLFVKDDGRPVRHPDVFVPRIVDLRGGPVLQDLRGAYNIVKSRLNESRSNHEPPEHNYLKVMQWMEDRALKQPLGYYRCLIPGKEREVVEEEEGSWEELEQEEAFFPQGERFHHSFDYRKETNSSAWFDDEANYGAEATQEKVRWYQTILKVAAGYPQVPVNGKHNDVITREAMRDFQKRNNLRETGYLQVDSNLALTKIALEWIHKISIAGQLGKRTNDLKGAIKDFQRKNNLKDSGSLGLSTMAKMIEVINSRSINPPEPIPPKPTPAGILDFRLKETKVVAGLIFPKEMPRVNFPKISTNREKHKTTDVDTIRKSWALSHFYVWRAHQLIEFLDKHPKDRKTMWKSGYSSIKKYDNFSPRAWFGPYDEKRFQLIKVGIQKVWNLFLKRRPIKIKSRAKCGGCTAASHVVKGVIKLCDLWFDPQKNCKAVKDNFERGQIIVHELFHHIFLPNGMPVTDFHFYHDKNNKLVKCRSINKKEKDWKPCKIYGEERCYNIAHIPGRNNRNFKVATRNNDSYAIFIYKLGKKIYKQQLLYFP